MGCSSSEQPNSQWSKSDSAVFLRAHIQIVQGYCWFSCAQNFKHKNLYVIKHAEYLLR